ncbi:hypothetical protein SAMN06295912_102224 [Sphingomonas laterariae]|uniref:Outer membrane lipoprotein-sorting protein n=1 Tax=Edaphosphingomonas laterariae TaxID=861865 RepID=A0A239CJB5_9SPHN|nr:DUF2092 domain-containing protein [Sphingomonas laterariae]SNS19791.1 hypothetical protein SAMN06295912_102224 [Sphingomonas laterariae]
MRIIGKLLAGAISLAISGTAYAQATPPPAAPPAPAATTGEVDKQALAALQVAVDYLRKLKSFELRVEATSDEVVDDDTKIELIDQVRYDFTGPDKLFIDWRSDRVSRQLYFNGKTATVFAPRMGYYASLAMPGTVEDFLLSAAQDYGIIFPLPDIFLWAIKTVPPYKAQRALRVGYARIAGADTDQYLFRDGDVDWQVWIERGERPLLRKIVLTSRTDPLQPKYSALLQWNLNPELTPDRFTFQPPEGTRPIDIVNFRAAGAAQ